MGALRLWLAALTAILLVGYTSMAFAQGQNSARCGGSGKLPCYLTATHYQTLEGRIVALEGRIQGLDRLFQWEPSDGDTGSGGGARSGATSTTATSSYAGWHGGFGLRGGLAIMSTSDNDATAGLAKVYGLGRWVDTYSHLGVELLVGMGVWPIRDSAPFALSGRLGAVASWDLWGIFVAPELMPPLQGQGGGTPWSP